MTERQHATWGELLRDAVEKPGRLLEAYTAFHNYSFGNALLALEQCIRRNSPAWSCGSSSCNLSQRRVTPVDRAPHWGFDSTGSLLNLMSSLGGYETISAISRSSYNLNRAVCMMGNGFSDAAH